MKKLSDILWFDIPNKFKELLVSNICDDSRKVTEGCMFVAISGSIHDGNKYISDAIASGAKYIVLDDKNAKPGMVVENNGTIFIYVENARIALAKIASAFFQSKFRNIISVTGTSGKSSTVDIVRQIWMHDGRKAASIGTLGVIINNETAKLSENLTSPGAIELRKIFNNLNKNCVTDIAMEASSHGIDQHRLDCIDFSVCAFTNMSQDHLDYHGTMENYWNAKEKLFSELASDKTIFVANADSEYFNKINEIAKKRNIKCVSYGYKSSDIKIISVEARTNHQDVKISFFENEFSFSLPLYGEFQVYNSMCAAAICYFTGVKIDNIINALTKLNTINGRLEHVVDFNSAKIYIDYSHKPDALKNAILSLRKYNPKRIITVFGCGGDRDQQKRKLMGEVASKFSDIVIVTDDNPRSEDPAQIRKMILEGCANIRVLSKSSIFEDFLGDAARKTAVYSDVHEDLSTGSTTKIPKRRLFRKNFCVFEIGDRKEAIEYAIDSLSEGDALLVAGKGHETYQQNKEKLIHFSDKEIILEKVLK